MGETHVIVCHRVVDRPYGRPGIRGTRPFAVRYLSESVGATGRRKRIPHSERRVGWNRVGTRGDGLLLKVFAPLLDVGIGVGGEEV